MRKHLKNNDHSHQGINKQVRKKFLGLLFLSCFSLASFQSAHANKQRFKFDVPETTVNKVLGQIAQKSNTPLLLPYDKVKSIPANRVKGRYTLKQALDIALKGTGLTAMINDRGVITVDFNQRPDGSTGGDDMKNSTKSALLASAATALVATATPVAAEDDRRADDPGIDEIISIGTRAKGRTSLETPVPVDVIGFQELQKTGATEVGRMLQIAAPSFNFSSSSISDGTDAVRPATLRGLGPDQTLVLVNGKRRHTSALIHVNTSVGRGTAGVDMNAIPGIAIKRIEVLRDGAAAQYGSDAIAGVINIELRDQDEGGEARVHWGETYEGDGETFVGSASYGIGIGDGGHLTLAAEYRNRENTNRAGLSGAVQYELVDGECGTACELDPREATFDRQNFRIGDSDSEQKALVLTGALPLSENAEAYIFGSYSDRENQSAGFYRRQNQVDRTVIELYPDGFLPLINSDIQDRSLAGGIEWVIGDDWFVDTSVSYGSNSFQFIISNSLNASFGANSPTIADAGTLEISQTTFNIDVSKTFDNINIAFGAERRNENYQINAGEPISYSNGGAVNTNCNGCDMEPVTYASGFQVFRGFSPDNEVDESRNNWAVYFDVEADISDNFTLAGAVRYEDYSDFGDTFNGKIAARFNVSDEFALRGSASTGFRAPSMQQQFFNNTSTQFVTVGTETVIQERGTFRNDSAIAQALGVPELQEEKSLNFSAGFVATLFDNLTITADYYHIDIDDRIALSGAINIAADFPDVSAATGATSGQFFTNLADTKTQGIDFVATYDVELDGDQSLKLSAAANWTETEIKDGTIQMPVAGVSNTSLFTPQDQSIVEEWQPETRLNLSADYSTGPWALLVRLNMFGKYTVCEGSCDTPSGPGQNIQEFGSKWLTDIQVSYTFEEADLTLSAGANNLFDVTPDGNLIGQARGGTIPGIVDSPGVFQFSRRSAPFGFNGGYYYLTASYRF